MYDNELQHYGVKGMKWGKRRAARKEAKQQFKKQKYIDNHKRMYASTTKKEVDDAKKMLDLFDRTKGMSKEFSYLKEYVKLEEGSRTKKEIYKDERAFLAFEHKKKKFEYDHKNILSKNFDDVLLSNKDYNETKTAIGKIIDQNNNEYFKYMNNDPNIYTIY